MGRVIRTLIAALLAVFVTAPVFAQPTAQSRHNRAPRQQGLTPEQRRAARQALRARRAMRVRRGLRRMDRDGNGAISRQEWTRRPQLFDRLDANKDGQLTREELRRLGARRRSFQVGR
jgi:Ca2+-binding EF-hand superfamily protein